jgi:hypothetical protein
MGCFFMRKLGATAKKSRMRRTAMKKPRQGSAERPPESEEAEESGWASRERLEMLRLEERRILKSQGRGSS